MYKPVKDGIQRDVKSVVFTEAHPPAQLHEIVHCFWELKTKSPLPEDFLYHVIPDACVNILFNQLETKIAAVTALQMLPKKLNLGKVFHYVGVQLLPGVWWGSPDQVIRGFVGENYQGNLPLIQVNNELSELDFPAKQVVLSQLIEELISKELVRPNIVTSRILKRLNEIRTVADMAKVVGFSSRQLQRAIKEATGFSPHDFLKILRLQQSFRQDYLDYYSDQAHYIHSFRRITGYTPLKYAKKFDV
jgi:AraC-like DNA-binding protein